jgi:hypothetical protein
MTKATSAQELFKGRHFDREIIVLCLRWYLTFKLSSRDLVQMMAEEHDMPVHHLLDRILDEYIVVAGLQSGQPLFQSVNSAGTAVTGRALNRYNAWAAIAPELARPRPPCAVCRRS